MATRIKYLILIVFIFCCGCEEEIKQTPHPHAQIEYAEKISGLNLPADIQLAEDRELVYNEETGGRELMSRYEIDSTEMQPLIAQCIEKKFSRLPIPYKPMQYYNPNSTDSGYYQLTYSPTDSLNVKLVVINTVHNQLMIVRDSV